jgi:hypothetical protein
MTSNLSVDSIPRSARRKKRAFLRVPPKKKSRLDGYQTAKGGKESDEAGNDKKQIPQCSMDRQGTGQTLLSIEMLAGLFSDLELKVPVRRALRKMETREEINSDWLEPKSNQIKSRPAKNSNQKLKQSAGVPA